MQRKLKEIIECALCKEHIRLAFCLRFFEHLFEHHKFDNHVEVGTHVLNHVLTEKQKNASGIPIPRLRNSIRG
jgi:hypothetical protein